MVTLRRLCESHIENAGGDVKEGQKRFAEQVSRLAAKGELKADNVSFKELFETLVNYQLFCELQLYFVMPSFYHYY